MAKYKILPFPILTALPFLLRLFLFLSFLPFYGQYLGSWLHACSNGFKRSL